MDKQINIKVFGKVQGVYFRQSTKDKADYLGLKGVVMNSADGSVYISVRGDEEKLQKFVSYCKIGPEMSEVINVLVEDEELKDFKSFSILR